MAGGCAYLRCSFRSFLQLVGWYFYAHFTVEGTEALGLNNLSGGYGGSEPD